MLYERRAFGAEAETMCEIADKATEREREPVQCAVKAFSKPDPALKINTKAAINLAHCKQSSKSDPGDL